MEHLNSENSLLPRIKKFYWGLLSGTYKQRIKNILTRCFKYERFYLYELSLQNDMELFQSKLINLRKGLKTRFQTKWLTEETIEHLPLYLKYRQDIPEHEVTQWVRNGMATVMILDKGKIIGDCWLGIKSFPFPDRAIAEILKVRGYAYCFKAYVDSWYRGRGIFPLLIGEQVVIAQLKGVKTLFSAISPGNIPSIKSVEKVGFKHFHTLHLLQVWGKSYVKLMKALRIIKKRGHK